MTLQEIENLQLDDVRVEIISRLLINDINNLPEGESWIIEIEPFTIHPNLTMPSEQELEAEFLVYTSELRATEEARIAEINRIAERKIEIDLLLSTDIRRYFQSVVPNQPNPEAYFRDVLKDPSRDTELLQLIDDLKTEKQALELADQQQNEIDAVEQMRRVRDQYLRDTDFTQLADAPFTSEQKLEYRTYRQYLRDLPQIYEQEQILEPVTLTFDEWKLNPPTYSV